LIALGSRKSKFDNKRTFGSDIEEENFFDEDDDFRGSEIPLK